MPRDGEEPAFKFRFATMLVAAREDADPGFRKKIFGALFVSRDVDKIAEQAILILLDQAVEQIGVAPLQAARDALCFIAHQRGEEQSWTGHGGDPIKNGPLWGPTWDLGAHSKWYRGSGAEKNEAKREGVGAQRRSGYTPPDFCQ